MIQYVDDNNMLIARHLLRFFEKALLMDDPVVLTNYADYIRSMLPMEVTVFNIKVFKAKNLLDCYLEPGELLPTDNMLKSTILELREVLHV